MLPNFLVVGLVVGLLARRTPIWLPVLMGVLWAVVIAADLSPDSGTLAVAWLLGAANTACGLLVGRLFRGVEGLVYRALRT